MTEAIPPYLRNWPTDHDTGDGGSAGYAFPTLGGDRYDRTARLGHLAMKLHDWHGQPFSLIATHDTNGAPLLGLALHPGAGLDFFPSERPHVWHPDPGQAAPPQPAIVLSPEDLRRLVPIAHALLRSLDLTTAAATRDDA